MALRRNDKILLYYPFVFYALGGILIYWGVSYFSEYWGRSQVTLSAIATFVILGNFAHNFLSIWQIGRLESFRNWAREYRFHGLSIWHIVILSYLVAFGLISLLPNGFDTFRPDGKFTITEQMITYLLIILNSHHALAQSRGISIGLSHQYIKDKSLIESLTKKEKFFYFILFVDAFFFIAPLLTFNIKFSEYFLPIRNLLLFGFFAWISWAYFKLPKAEAKIKLLFLVRYLYRFAFGFHPITAFFAFGFHGADANLIYWNSIEKDASARAKYLKIEFISLLLILGLLYLYFYSSSMASSYFVQFVLPGFFISHYLVEGFMYRMKNPVTRKHISKII